MLLQVLFCNPLLSSTLWSHLNELVQMGMYFNQTIVMHNVARANMPLSLL
jgi:hypothetical protein